MDILSIVITAVFGFVSTMLAYLLQQSHKENKRLKQEQQKRHTAMEDGLVCILRKHLMDEHELWMRKGYITPKSLENGLLMYKAYKSLGGNGMIDHMEEEIQQLQIKEINVEKREAKKSTKNK